MTVVREQPGDDGEWVVDAVWQVQEVAVWHVQEVAVWHVQEVAVWQVQEVAVWQVQEAVVRKCEQRSVKNQGFDERCQVGWAQETLGVLGEIQVVDVRKVDEIRQVAVQVR